MAADPPEEPAKVEERPPTTPSSAALLDCRSSEEIKAVARKYADHPLQNTDPGAWAVLTAISKNARQRPQVRVSGTLPVLSLPPSWRQRFGTLFRARRLGILERNIVTLGVGLRNIRWNVSILLL